MKRIHPSAIEKLFSHRKSKLIRTVSLFVTMVLLLETIFSVTVLNIDAAASYFTVRINYLYTNGNPIHDPYIATYSVNETPADYDVTNPIIDGFEPMMLTNDGNDPEELPTGGNLAETTHIEFNGAYEDKTYNVYYVPGLTHYAARYYLQNIYDDLYTLDRPRTEANTNRIGETGTTPDDLEAEVIPGFTSLFHEPDAIAADGSTVFRVYYDRNYYSVNFDLGEGGYGVEPVYAKYESVYRIDEPTRMGYTFLGWARTDKDSSINTYDETGLDEDGWHYIDANGDIITKENATAVQNLVQLEGDQTVPAENTYYQAVWEAGTTHFSVVYWIEIPESELKYDGHDYDGLTQEQKEQKISRNYSVLTAKDVYQIQKNSKSGGLVDVEAGMTIQATDSIRNYARKAYDEGYDGATGSKAGVVQINDLFSFNLGYANPNDPRNEDPDPDDPGYDPDAPVYKFDADGNIIDFNDISAGTSSELNGARDFFEMNTSANSDEPLLISDTEITVRGDGTSHFNVFFRRKRFNLKFYYARQGYTNGVLDPNKISLTNSTKAFNNNSTEKEYLKTTSKNVLEAIAMGSWEQNSAETLPQVKDEYKQRVTEGYDDFTDSHYNGYYRYYYYQLQAKYNEPLKDKWLIDALDTVHRKGSAEAEICYPGSIATEYYNKYYQDRSSSGNYTVKGIYEKLDKGILFTDSARTTMKQNNIDYTELHFLISWTNTSYNNGWNSSITRVLHFRYENYTELLPREVEIVENNGTQALLAEGNYTDVRQFTTKVNENGSWVTKTKWYGLSTDHVYETIDSGNQYDRNKSLSERNTNVRVNQTPTVMTGFELEYYRKTNKGLVILDDDNTEIDWSEDTTNYRRCTIKFFYRRHEYTLKYRNGNRKDESHTRTVMYGAPINSQYIVAEDGHEVNEYRYYWPDPEYFDENRRDYFTFESWYNDPRYDNAFDLATQTMPADDYTLFAKWSPKNINVVFYNTYDDYYIDRKDQHSEKKIVLNQHEIDLAEEEEETPPDELKVLPVDYGSYVPLSRIPINNDSEDNPRPRLTPVAEGASFAGWYYIRNRVPVRYEPENVPVTAMNQESTGDNGTLRLFAEWVTKDVAKYKIKYVKESDQSVEVAPPTTGRAYVWKTKTFNAKSGDELYDEYKWTAEGEDEGNNWWPTTNSSSLVVKANNQGSEYAPNELTFTYIQKNKVAYKVQYLDATTRRPINPGNQDVIKESSHASVSEDAIIIPGYIVENASQSIVLTASTKTDPDEQRAEELENNVITFLYRENTSEYLYQVDYLTEDLSGDGYSLYSSETLTVPIASEGDTTVAISALHSRPVPTELQNTGYTLKANSTTYTVTDATGVTDPTQIPVADNGSIVVVDNDKKTVKIYFDRKDYSYVYYYIDHTAEKAYNDATPEQQASMWNGVIATHNEASNVAPVGQVVTLNVPTDIAHFENPVTHDVSDYTRLANSDGTLNDVTLTIQPDDNNVGLNVVKVYYRKDIERELNYKMICVNDNEDTDYYNDASRTPKFGRLNLSFQTVQDFNDIQNVTFYDNNSETDAYDNYLHLHQYTFLGWYTTPNYDPDHPETGRLTGPNDPTLSNDELGTSGELPAKDTKYYALVKQDMVKMDVMFYYTDDYTVAEFKAADEDTDDLTTLIQSAVDNYDNPSVADNEKVHDDGEMIGKEVVFTAPNGYQNHSDIPWHRNDGYSLYMNDTDNRVFKYQFAEWWEVNKELNNALIRHDNWNSSFEWDPDSLSQQVPRNKDQYLIAVYARRDLDVDYVTNYQFVDRFGSQQTYVKKGTLTSDQLDHTSANYALTNDGDARLKDSFILSQAPYESNHGEILLWSNRAGMIEKTSFKAGTTLDDGTQYEKDTIVTTITAVQNDRTVYAHYRTTPTGAYGEPIVTTYGANYKHDPQMEAIEAPASYNGHPFSYWAVRKSGSETAPIVAKSYTKRFDLCMMDNYWLSPVYDESAAAAGPGSKSAALDVTTHNIAQGDEDWLAWTWNEGEDGVWVRPDSNMIFRGLNDYVKFVRVRAGTSVTDGVWDAAFEENVWNYTEDDDQVVQNGQTLILTDYYHNGTKYIAGSWTTDPEEPSGGDDEDLPAETTEDASVKLTFLDYTRNQWTDAEGVINPSGETDLLFADFEIAFEDNGNQIYRSDDYKTGVILEYCAKVSDSATFDPTRNYNQVTNYDNLTTAVTNHLAGQNVNQYSYKTNKNRTIQFCDIPTTDLTDHNRVEFGKYIKNAYRNNGTEEDPVIEYTNNSYLLKATAYLVDKDGNVTFSQEPVYVCYKNIASQNTALPEMTETSD